VREPRTYTVSLLREALPKYCRGVAADVGCGRGKYRELIARHAARYVGLDNLTSLRQFGPGGKAAVDVVADVMALPLAAKSCDTVVCLQVIEHLPEPGALMAELGRVCRPGGHLLLATGWLAPYHAEPRDYYRFSVDAFDYLFDRHGFDLVELNPNGGPWTLLVWSALRVVELRSPAWRRRLGRAMRPLELAAERLDAGKRVSRNSLGYFGVGRRRG
jgi:SAM-dependent methyltransferase